MRDLGTGLFSSHATPRSVVASSQGSPRGDRESRRWVEGGESTGETLSAGQPWSCVREMLESQRNWREHVHSMRVKATQFQPAVLWE